jgi:hypothetical protein
VIVGCDAYGIFLTMMLTTFPRFDRFDLDGFFMFEQCPGLKLEFFSPR